MAISLLEILDQISRQLKPVSETSTLDAQVLLSHILQKTRSWILAYPEYQVPEDQISAIRFAQNRLADGEPLPYVIGHWEFYGLDFILTPDVLIPRPETELIVDRAIAWLQRNPHRRRAIDIGTGCGCIGISIAKNIPDVHMILSDISEAAPKVAKQNCDKHGLLDRVEIRYSDLLSKIPGPYTLDLICANLPYIPTQTLSSLSVAKSEPRTALDGGKSGLKLIKRLLKQAKGILDAGGLILLEIAPEQRDQVIQLAYKNYPSAKIQLLQDLSGKERCVEIETRYTIFHLCQRKDWMSSLQRGEFTADSLLAEGFIHCSRSTQIIDVANRYYHGVSDMVVLFIDPEKLVADIRWEKSGEQYYPHVYGPINLSAVSHVLDVRPDSDGIYRQIYTEINQ